MQPLLKDLRLLCGAFADNILKLALKLFGFESAIVSLVADKSYKVRGFLPATPERLANITMYCWLFNCAALNTRLHADLCYSLSLLGSVQL